MRTNSSSLSSSSSKIIIELLSTIALLIFKKCGNALSSSLPSTNSLPPKQPRIVNGDYSDNVSRSFFVKSAYDHFGYTADVLCGATLISPDIIITAAHCQGAFNHGAFILDERSNDFTRKVSIDFQRRHPGWEINRDSLNFDVLLLRLSTPLSSDDVAKPIIINTDSNYPSNGDVLTAYGFGLTENGIASQRLREADVTYIDNDTCWGRGIQFNNVMKGEDVLCTDPYGGSTATCLGDSGGPLTDASGNLLTGVISFGSGCQADYIPDGHVRLSEISEWVEKQICMLSVVPPSTCPPKKVSRDPGSVQMKLDFTHDYYPEETTFVIRNYDTLDIVYTGPEYVPSRNGHYESRINLLPGVYTFEVYDLTGNGLVSGSVQESLPQDGSWTLFALYDGSTETEVAQGGPEFTNQQVTKFTVTENAVIINDAATQVSGEIDKVSNQLDNITKRMDECLAEKQSEETIGAMYSTSCLCEIPSGKTSIELVCTDANNQFCSPNHGQCYDDSDCCSGRRCHDRICRSTIPIANSNGRYDNRIGIRGGGSSSGASSASAPRTGNYRRIRQL